MAEFAFPAHNSIFIAYNVIIFALYVQSDIIFQITIVNLAIYMMPIVKNATPATALPAVMS